MKANYNLTLMQRHNIRKQYEALANQRIDECEEDIAYATDVTVLYALHRYPGTQWGAKRCENFYQYMTKVHGELRMRYGMENDPNSAIWAAARDLKEVGIDVRAMRDAIKTECVIFAAPSERKRCPDCSCILDDAGDWRFCPHCGKSLKK